MFSLVGISSLRGLIGATIFSLLSNWLKMSLTLIRPEPLAESYVRRTLRLPWKSSQLLVIELGSLWSTMTYLYSSNGGVWSPCEICSTGTGSERQIGQSFALVRRYKPWSGFHTPSLLDEPVTTMTWPSFVLTHTTLKMIDKVLLRINWAAVFISIYCCVANIINFLIISIFCPKT